MYEAEAASFPVYYILGNQAPTRNSGDNQSKNMSHQIKTVDSLWFMNKLKTAFLHSGDRRRIFTDDVIWKYLHALEEKGKRNRGQVDQLRMT